MNFISREEYFFEKHFSFGFCFISRGDEKDEIRKEAFYKWKREKERQSLSILRGCEKYVYMMFNDRRKKALLVGVTNTLFADRCPFYHFLTSSAVVLTKTNEEENKKKTFHN